MSVKPPPGPGDKTVIIRPNPGGRRDAPSPAQRPAADDLWGSGQSAPPAAGQPSGYRMPPAAPLQAAPQVPYPQFPGGQAPPAAGVSRPDVMPPVSNQPRPPMTSRAAEVGPPVDLGFDKHPPVISENHIMAAARPLLLLLSNVRLSADHAQVAPFMEAVAMEIGSIERKLQSARIPAEQIRLCKYAMCATADDIVQNLPGTDRTLWTQFSMAARFFGDRGMGVGFFEELNRAKMQAAVNADVLELIYACLSLGFQGQYRSSPGGEVALAQIRRDLYQTIRAFRERPPVDISPHWQGQDIEREMIRAHLPIWVPWAAAASLLAILLIGYRLLLGFSSDALAAQFVGLHPMTEVQITRADYKPLQPVVVETSTQMKRIRDKLTGDISAGRLTVAEVAGKVVIRLKTDTMFEIASADVKADFVSTLANVAVALDKEPKEISVIGHSDDTPITSRLKFKNNQELSEERAKAVAQIMAPKLSDAARLVTAGRGPDEPLVPNTSAQNRAKNRRVEVFLPRTGP